MERATEDKLRRERFGRFVDEGRAKLPRRRGVLFGVAAADRNAHCNDCRRFVGMSGGCPGMPTRDPDAVHPCFTDAETGRCERDDLLAELAAIEAGQEAAVA